MHSLDVSLLSRCQSEIKNDASTYGISCVKDLLDVQEIHISYPTDVWRLKQDSHAAAIASGNNAAIQYANSDVLAITNATVLTMESGRLHEDFMGDAVVIVRAGLIESVGHADKVVVPQGATVINAHRGMSVRVGTSMPLGLPLFVFRLCRAWPHRHACALGRHD